MELISQYSNNLLGDYFGVKKNQKLITRKYYLLIIWHIVKIYIQIYIKSYGIYLIFKIVKDKFYNNL